MLFAHLPDRYLIGMGLWLLGGIVLFVALLKLRRWRRRKGAKPRILNALLGLWFLAAMLTGVEAYFALFRDTTDAFNQTNVSKRWFAIHADAEARDLKFENGEGIRYRETAAFEQEVLEGVKRVIFLGDSFTFGHGINDMEDRFSNRVGNNLESQQSGQWDVANLAWAGTNLPWTNAVTHQLVDNKYDVDTVVYVMCLNDVEGFVPSEYADVGKHASGSPFFRDTYFLNTVYFRAKQLMVPNLRNYYGTIAEHYAGEPWQKMTDMLDDTKKTCHHKQTRFAIVVFPFLHNLTDSGAFDAAHQAIAKYGEDSDVPVLDLRATLAPHAGEGLTLNMLDAHPNERAHELAAAEIAKFLLELPELKPAAAASKDGTQSQELEAQ